MKIFNLPNILPLQRAKYQWRTKLNMSTSSMILLQDKSQASLNTESKYNLSKKNSIVTVLQMPMWNTGDKEKTK